MVAGLAGERLQGAILPLNDQYLNRAHITEILGVWKEMLVADSIAGIARVVQEEMPLYLLLTLLQ